MIANKLHPATANGQPLVCARLPLFFDAPGLLAEVRALPPSVWVPHFNMGYHNGGWTGATLRGPRGDPTRLYVAPSAGGEVRDTDLLVACPRLRAALTTFTCPVLAARLLRLAPQGVIAEHCDPDLRPQDGQARLHVPLLSNASVEFYVNCERLQMECGECWYLNLSLPHRVSNRGTTERIHLVIDVEMNEWLCALITEGDHPQRIAPTPSGAEEFARFRERVLDDVDLGARLRAETDREAFVALTVSLAAQRGFLFGSEDVQSALAEGHRRWLSQWIV